MPALFGALRKGGVYAFGRYNIVHIAPPLVIEEAELDQALAVLDTAIGELSAAHAAAAK
jgi:taurine--2-oxoglutarate transaminase